ncbi:translation initiation factor IF-2 [Candidatus Parcubacteria bacterium]|nr:translation initiation factor IF-2 [Candidatus Parcubacteria bacterium]
MTTQTATGTRPPVVVVMGHIDHGKTALLDAIRKTSVVDKESGGITQHIGAYQVTVRPVDEQSSRAEPKASPERSEGARGIPRPDSAGSRDDFATSDRKITFLDTPGHEAFSAIRSRGAKVADVAILVVASDEGVKPQTLEAAAHIAAAEIPFVVAISKIDKPEANPERVKKELSEQGIQVESWGGKVPSVELSAKTGAGIPELLELILLVAELEGVSADSSGPASGVVIEANLDARRGPVATLLVQSGTLRTGDVVAAGGVFGAVRAMNGADGQTILEAGPATPVAVLGLGAGAPLGERFEVVTAKHVAEERAKAWRETHPTELLAPADLEDVQEGRPRVRLVAKADVEGSREAVLASLKAITVGEVQLAVIRSGVGNINETDIKFAIATKARVVGFRVKVESRAETLAQQAKVPVETFDVIYELIERVREIVKAAAPSVGAGEAELGELTVLAVFRTEANRMVVGGRVTRGLARRGANVQVLRAGEVIATGRLAELQQGKVPAEEVPEGKECGLLIVGTNVIAAGDTLMFFEAG